MHRQATRLASQLSFFSSEARPPRVADLSGSLCGPGQTVGFGAGTAARLSVVVDEAWRARALAAAYAERGVAAELARTTEGHPFVRTAFRVDLVPLATAWLRGAVKSVPADYELDGPALRLWTLTSGRPGPTDASFLLGLDPHAPDTHEPLASALSSAGLPTTLLGARSGGPLLRIAGRRRLLRLSELVGGVPAGVDGGMWPHQ